MVRVLQKKPQPISECKSKENPRHEAKCASKSCKNGQFCCVKIFLHNCGSSLMELFVI